MATKEEVGGITAKRKPVVVIPKKDDPRRQFMSRDEVLKENAIEKEAAIAAENARIKTLEEHRSRGASKQAVEAPPVEDKVSSLRKRLAEAKKKLDADPDSKYLKKKVAKLEDALEEAEAAAD